MSNNDRCKYLDIPASVINNAKPLKPRFETLCFFVAAENKEKADADASLAAALEHNKAVFELAKTKADASLALIKSKLDIDDACLNKINQDIRDNQVELQKHITAASAARETFDTAKTNYNQALTSFQQAQTDASVADASFNLADAQFKLADASFNLAKKNATLAATQFQQEKLNIMEVEMK